MTEARDLAAERQRILGCIRVLRALGFSLFPVHHPWTPPQSWVAGWADDAHSGKRPAVRWSRYQTEMATDAEVDEWFAGDRLHNVGVATGRLSGVVVIESDSGSALEWMVDHLPTSPWRVTTSAPFRQHWYFRDDHNRLVSNGARISAAGGLPVDVRGHGGYVLGPGSRHRSGSLYGACRGSQWASPKSELPTVPADLKLDADRPPASSPPVSVYFGSADDAYRKAQGWMAKRDPAVAGQGGDHWTFVTAAAMVKDFGLPDSMAWSLLCDWNSRCEPPWGERELREKLENAKRYGKTTEGSKLVGGSRSAEPVVTIGRYGRDESLPVASPAAAATAAPSEPEPEVLKELAEMDKVVRKDLDFLIYPWILRREITLLAGDGGVGKSFVSAAIAAAVTGGPQIPGLQLDPDAWGGRVLFFSAEDDLETVLKPRLDSSGADSTRIRAFPMHEHGFVFDTEHLARLEQYIDAYRPTLLVVDPIVAFLPVAVDMNTANHVSSVLDRLNALAVRYGCAVLVVAHLSKNGGIYGSIGFRNRARSVLKVYRSPESNDRMAIAQEKSNYSALQSALAYHLHQSDPDDRQSCRLVWSTTRRPWSAQELESAQVTGFDREAVDEAESFLITELGSGRAVPANAVQSAARTCGIDQKLLAIARRRLGCVLEKDFDEWKVRMPRDDSPRELAGEVPL